MKITLELDGESYSLDLSRNSSESAFLLRGAQTASGSASIVEAMPGVFSVLLGRRSFQVYVAPNATALEVWVGTRRHTISISDPKDRPAKQSKASASGPMELRAQMPGKVVALLAPLGAEVKAGQGLVVVEAMKMQNEMKSPKNGVVSKIYAAEGATVVAGQVLIVVE